MGMRRKKRFFAKIFSVSVILCMFIFGGVFFKEYLGDPEETSIILYAQDMEGEPFLPSDIEISESGEESLPAEEAIEEGMTSELPTEESEEEGMTSETPTEEQAMEEEETKPEDSMNPEESESIKQDFFEDTLFIGDSRTVGIMQYGGIRGATFYASSGMSVFLLEKKTVYIPEEGRMVLSEVLERKQYKKIFLMLGINELGYPFESIEKKYGEVVEQLKASQGEAVIYLCANLHVTKEQSEKDSIYNNENVNRVNQMIAGLADNERTFYVDVNGLFDDEEGNLSMEYACDGFHVWGRFYTNWADWLQENAG